MPILGRAFSFSSRRLSSVADLLVGGTGVWWESPASSSRKPLSTYSCAHPATSSPDFWASFRPVSSQSGSLSSRKLSIIDEYVFSLAIFQPLPCVY